MKITHAGLYLVIGAINEVTIVYNPETVDYRVHFFIDPNYTEKIIATNSLLEDIGGSVRAWTELGRAYAFVRNLGWTDPITLETIEIVEEPK